MRGNNWFVFSSTEHLSRYHRGNNKATLLLQEFTHSAWIPCHQLNLVGSSTSSASFSKAVLLPLSLKCFRNGFSPSAKVTTSSIRMVFEVVRPQIEPVAAGLVQ